MDFQNIDYLKAGTEQQKKAHTILNNNRILSLLQPFDPILIGTFPLDIAIDTSDLDIACHCPNHDEFISWITKCFGGLKDFSIKQTFISGQNATIANFAIEGFAIEIFGQNFPVKLQNGYRHMIIENGILNQKGEDFRQQIIALKKQGFKTEPAFAQLLGLSGDPYEALLHYKI